MALVTLDEAKRHLRVFHYDEDETIDEFIDIASAAIIDYLKVSEDSPAWTPLTVPLITKQAVFLLIRTLYDNRGAETTDTNDYIKDNGPIANLLRRSRDPAMA